MFGANAAKCPVKLASANRGGGSCYLVATLKMRRARRFDVNFRFRLGVWVCVPGDATVCLGIELCGFQLRVRVVCGVPQGAQRRPAVCSGMNAKP